MKRWECGAAMGALGWLEMYCLGDMWQRRIYGKE